MRIVSLLASGTEIVVGLGAGQCLVGRSHECDNPPWVSALPMCTRPAFDVSMTSGQIDAEVRRRLKAGEPLYHVDTDLINSLKPDLLITQEHCAVCAVTPADVARAGCAVATQVLALQAGNVQGIFDGIVSVGRALVRHQDAANLVAAMKSRMSEVHDAVKHRRAPSLVALEWTDPVFAMGNWGPELVEAANGRLLLGEKGEYSTAIDWQKVRAADPEWLIIAPCGFDLERTMREVPTLEALPGWSDLRAVRQGQVVLADGNKYFNRSGTTIVQTVEILAEILHGYAAGHQGTAWVRLSMPGESLVVRELHAHACAHGRPSYTDPATGFNVFTADFLTRRGYCCGYGCRHCPYPIATKPVLTPNGPPVQSQRSGHSTASWIARDRATS
jgi:iron complex transport system substrate-binding protein